MAGQACEPGRDSRHDKGKPFRAMWRSLLSAIFIDFSRLFRRIYQAFFACDTSNTLLIGPALIAPHTFQPGRNHLRVVFDPLLGHAAAIGIAFQHGAHQMVFCADGEGHIAEKPSQVGTLLAQPAARHCVDLCRTVIGAEMIVTTGMSRKDPDTDGSPQRDWICMSWLESMARWRKLDHREPVADSSGVSSPCAPGGWHTSER